MVDVRRGSEGSRPREAVGSVATGDDQVTAVAARLRAEFGAADQQYVERRVRDEFGRWQEARITQFVPLLVERNVRAELRAGR